MCSERGCKFFVPENSLLVDNGAMIAYLGEIIYDSVNNKKIKSGISNVNNKKIKVSEEVNKNKNDEAKLIYYPRDFDSLDINPRERTDDVNVKWR